jgi:WD40 repeat protein/Flp pilus assembly protein TadD
MRHAGRVWAVAFSADGNWILTGSEDHTARLWTAPVPARGDLRRLVRWVEVSLGMELTPDGSSRALPTEDWQKRQRELDTLGGPPRLPAKQADSTLAWHHRLADDYQTAGHWFAAGRHFDQAIAANPRDWFPHALRGRMLVRAGQLGLAERECARAAELGPPDTVRDWVSRQSPEFDREVSWKAAVWYLDQFIRVRPKDGLAHVLRARARFLSSKSQEAQADFRRALELGPRDQVLARFRSYLQECETNREWQTGLWYADQLIQAEPRDVNLRNHRGNLYGYLRRFDLALSDYKQSIILGSTNWVEWDVRAALSLWAGDLKEYRETCAEALDRFGQSADQAAANGAVWICTDGPKAVADPLVPVEISERVTAAAPQSGQYLGTLGRALYRAGRYQEALVKLQQAQLLVSTEGTLLQWLFLAMTHDRLGHPKEARKWLDRSIQWLEESTPEKPKDASLGVPVSWPRWLLVNLQRYEAEALIRGSPAVAGLDTRLAFARAHVRLGQWEQAAGDFTKLLTARPKEASLRAERGRCLARLGQWDKAVADFTAALADRPEHTSWLLERALCWRQLKQSNRASADFARAIELRTKTAADRRQRFAAAPEVLEFRRALASALADLADAQRVGGRLAEALTTLTELRRLWPGHPTRLFEVARQIARCAAESRGNQEEPSPEQAAARRAVDLALEILSEAVVAGYPVTVSLRRDPALSPLRTRAAFQTLVSSADRKSTFAAPTGKVRRFAGHTTAWVEGVAFSADGRRALSCGHDHFVRLWDVQTGKEIRHFTGHRAPVFGVAFLPGGHRAVSSSSDGTVRLWDLETGKEVNRIKADSGWDQRLAIAPDGRLLFASNDGRLHLWDTVTWKEIRRFEGTTPHLTCMAFSRDGKQALSGGDDQSVRLWDVGTGKEIARFVAVPPKTPATKDQPAPLQGRSAAVWSVAFSPDQRQLLSAHIDGFVRLWDIADRREVRRFEGHWDSVRTVIFAAGGQRVISGAHNGRIIVWDTATGRELYRFATAPGTTQLSLSPDGRRLLSANNDAYVSLWLLSNEAARARRLLQLGQAREAEAVYRDAVKRSADGIDLQVERGRFFAGQGKWQAAAADLGKGLKANPDDEDLRLERGRCWAELARWDRTAEDFVHVIQRLGDDVRWSSHRSHICQELAQWDQAFEAAARMRPKDAHLRICRGRYLASLCRWDEARAAYAPVIAGRPLANNNEEPFEYACLLLLTKDAKAYQSFCRETAARAGPYPDAFTAFVLTRMCGLAKGALADPEQAVKWGEKSILFNKTNYNLHALAAAMVRAGKDQPSLTRLRESMAINWGSATVLNWLLYAIVCQHLGQDEFARTWLDRARIWFDRVPPAKPGKPLTSAHVLDWLEAHVLRREAEQIIHPKAGAP